MLILVLMLQNAICSIQQAGKCLKELEASIVSAYKADEWLELAMREHFISTIDTVTDISDVDVLLKQLRLLEDNIKDIVKSDRWHHWERQYWRVLTDPDIKVKTVTRFITTLMLLEVNLNHVAYLGMWNVWKRNEWLKKCTPLVDPLLNVSFSDDIFLNVDAMLKQFGYGGLKEYNMAATEVISVINSAARKLDKVTRDTGIADTTTEGVAVTAMIVTGLGLVFATFTGGATLALALAAGGVSLTGGSIIISIASDPIQKIWDEPTLQKVESATESITSQTIALIKVLESYARSAGNLKKELDSLQYSNALEYLKKGGSEISKTYNGSINIVRMITIIEQIRPDFVDKTSLPLLGFYPSSYDGMPKMLVQAVSSLDSAASELGMFVPGLSNAYGIWKTINGTSKLQEGNDLAKKFYGMAKNIATAKKKILSAYEMNVDEIYEKSEIDTRYDDLGRSEKWHRACFHGDMCVDLVLLSYGVKGNESEQICRRRGLYLLDIKSQKVSNIIRKYILKFGKSTWFSNESEFKELVPGSFDIPNNCVFFSQNDKFFVKNTNCFTREEYAVLCY